MNSRRLKYLGWALLACLFTGFSAIAEDIPAENVEVSTPVYRPSFNQFEPALGTYTYKVSWQGIPAATATISVERKGMEYQVATSVSVYQAIRLLYNLRYKAIGTMSAVDLTPVKAVFDQRENSREKFTTLTFLPNGEIRSVRKAKGKDTEVVQFNPNNFTLDPFSSAFMARSLDWKLGATKSFDTYNGRARYLIELTAVDKIKLDVNGTERDVWVISPKVKKLTSTDTDQKLREAHIYVTADKARDILLIKSEVFIGSVKTKLESFTPSRQAAPGTAVAVGKTTFSF